MNSYGPVSLANEAIYALLHYINWFSNDDIAPAPAPAPAPAHGSISIDSIPIHVDKMNESESWRTHLASSNLTP